MLNIRKNLFLLSLLPLLVFSQSKDPVTIAREALDKDVNYLDAIYKLKQIGKDLPDDQMQRAMFMQANLTLNAFLLNNSVTDSLWKLSFEGINFSENSFSFIAKDEDAIAGILKRSAHKQLVIIGEVHFYSRERYIMNKLLKDYYDNGFRFLAMEAIWEDQDSLNNRGYPIKSTGYYTFDPRMSNLIRDALRLGFTLVSYDHFGQEREYNQALNIYNKTFKDYPDAKVLILSGGDHMNKCERSRKMGYHIWQLSGIEPYNIRQIKQLQAIKKDYQGIGLEQSPDTCVFDLSLINGIQENEFRFRPDMEQKEFRLSNLFTPDIRKELAKVETFLSVYLENEFDKYCISETIPVIAYMVTKDLWNRSLVLPLDNYLLIVRDKDGHILHKIKLSTQ